MADYRNEQAPPTINTTVHATDEKSGMNMAYFILGGIVVVLAGLWLYYSNGNMMSGDNAARAPVDGATVTIENNAAPAVTPAPVAPATPVEPAAPAAPAPAN